MSDIPDPKELPSQYTIEEVNSLATMFETWHREAHSFRHKFKGWKKRIIRNKALLIAVISLLANIIQFVREVLR